VDEASNLIHSRSGDYSSPAPSAGSSAVSIFESRFLPCGHYSPFCGSRRSQLRIVARRIPGFLKQHAIGSHHTSTIFAFGLSAAISGEN
jgi:hypothetical protein